MTSTPCGDITCICCYPEFRHDCEKPDTAVHGEVLGCPDCGAVWVATSIDALPARIRVRVERTREIVAASLARRGRELPPQPTITWRQLVPATRLPGATP